MITKEEQKVYDILNELTIDYVRYEHKPIYTIEEADSLDIQMKGHHCKNLFVRNKKGDKHFLLIIEETKRADLKVISEAIKSTSLSFASEDRLFKYLSLTPGSITPFGLINDREKHVEVIIDSELLKADYISFHPNVNTATISITYNDFKKFLNWCGNKFLYIEM